MQHRMQHRMVGGLVAGFVGVVALSLLGSSAASAQVFRPRASQEHAVGVWTEFSVAYDRLDPIDDGQTGSRWEFGDAAQFRGSLQFPVNSWVAIGGTFTYANMPLVYAASSPGIEGGFANNAHAAVYQYLGTLHVGRNRGYGVQGSLDLNVGITDFHSFTSDDGNGQLPPRDGVRDFTVSLSPGFEVPFSPRAQLVLATDFGYVFHSRTGLANNARSGSMQHTPRIGLRLGF